MIGATCRLIPSSVRPDWVRQWGCTSCQFEQWWKTDTDHEGSDSECECHVLGCRQSGIESVCRRRQGMCVCCSPGFRKSAAYVCICVTQGYVTCFEYAKGKFSISASTQVVSHETTITCIHYSNWHPPGSPYPRPSLLVNACVDAVLLFGYETREEGCKASLCRKAHSLWVLHACRIADKPKGQLEPIARFPVKHRSAHFLLHSIFCPRIAVRAGAFVGSSLITSSLRWNTMHNVNTQSRRNSMSRQCVEVRMAE